MMTSSDPKNRIRAEIS